MKVINVFSSVAASGLFVASLAACNNEPDMHAFDTAGGQILAKSASTEAAPASLQNARTAPKKTDAKQPQKTTEASPRAISYKSADSGHSLDSETPVADPKKNPPQESQDGAQKEASGTPEASAAAPSNNEGETAPDEAPPKENEATEDADPEPDQKEQPETASVEQIQEENEPDAAPDPSVSIELEEVEVESKDQSEGKDSENKSDAETPENEPADRPDSKSASTAGTDGDAQPKSPTGDQGEKLAQQSDSLQISPGALREIEMILFQSGIAEGELADLREEDFPADQVRRNLEDLFKEAGYSEEESKQVATLATDRIQALKHPESVQKAQTADAMQENLLREVGLSDAALNSLKESGYTPEAVESEVRKALNDKGIESAEAEEIAGQVAGLIKRMQTQQESAEAALAGAQEEPARSPAPDSRISQAAEPASAGKGLSASQLLSARVMDGQGQSLGQIHDLMIDLNSGNVAYAVVALSSTGDQEGGAQSKWVAVPVMALSQSPDQSGSVVFNASREKLMSAPGLDQQDWPNLGGSAWGAEHWDAAEDEVDQQAPRPDAQEGASDESSAPAHEESPQEAPNAEGQPENQPDPQQQ